MFKDAYGYIFDARVDCLGRKGIKESYKIFNGIVDITCGVTGTGKITKAKTYTKTEGFVPLGYVVAEGMDKFMRSNRATYAVIGDCSFIARVLYNTRTGTFKTKVYVPMGDIEINKGSKKSYGCYCYLVSTEKGIHRFLVNQKVYDLLINSIESNISKMNVSSKDAYYNSRM